MTLTMHADRVVARLSLVMMPPNILSGTIRNITTTLMTLDIVTRAIWLGWHVATDNL